MTDEPEDDAAESGNDAAEPEDAAGEPEPTPTPDDSAATAKPKLSKAERLEAKAAKLREAEERRAAEAAARAEADEPTGRPAHHALTLTLAGVLVVGLVAGLIISLWHSHTLDGHVHAAQQRQHRAESNQLFAVRNEKAAQRAADDANAARTSAEKELVAAQAGSATGKPELVRSALTAAKQYAAEFGSYDYRHLDADFAQVAKLLTPSFRRSYTATSSKLKSAIEQVKGSSVATVQAVGLVSATDTSAQVAVFLDQKITTAQSSTPRIDRNRLIVTMERSAGTWLVSKLSSV